jgi:hypothetical protein
MTLKCVSEFPHPVRRLFIAPQNLSRVFDADRVAVETARRTVLPTLSVHVGSANRRVPTCSSVSGKQIVLGRARASRLQVAAPGR